ncbi:MAG: 23S rRNA (pseudouridine(1915)-N(3))-methyltransferase RlmH [Blautia massiliensis (ex Durand et al. 2017)]|uniref:23S rRNA (pseudouridine(1915)-N(3))-methyltransferase RlmH n=1 Tax=Blautia massiliensis (ex Durand et al. 2017) TaxID=1737424 RepID=UPI003993A292
MKISILTVGKIKEKYLRDAIAEYSKRLGRYCKLEIIEVSDEKTPDNASETVEDAIRNKEGERLLKYIRDDAFVITLEIGGEQLTSENFARKLNELGIRGTSHIQLCAQLRVCSQAGGIPVYPRFSQPDNSESWDDAGNGI